MARSILNTLHMVASPISYLIMESLDDSNKAVETASAKGIEKLREETNKQELRMRFMEHQAKVEQELAIARRIDSAEEVEIEEFFENAASGKGGLSIDATTASGGLSGEGQTSRVSRRIYRFKGYRQVGLPDQEIVQEAVTP